MTSISREVVSLFLLLMLAQQVPSSHKDSPACGIKFDQASTVPASDSVKQIVRHCRHLQPLDLIAYLHKLGVEKRISILAKLTNPQYPFSPWAAAELVQAIPPQQAIAFCRQLPLDSSEWQNAFYALGSHPKEDIIGYIREMAASPIPRVRCYSYWLCMREKWTDVVPYAKYDIDNQTCVMTINESEDEQTVAQIAAKYIRNASRWRIDRGDRSYPAQKAHPNSEQEHRKGSSRKKGQAEKRVRNRRNIP